MVVGHWVLLETVAIWYAHDDKQFSWYLKISWIILISIIIVNIRSILTSVYSYIKIFLIKHLWTPSIIFFSLSLIPYMDSASLKSITHLSNKYFFRIHWARLFEIKTLIENCMHILVFPHFRTDIRSSLYMYVSVTRLLCLPTL